LDFFQQASKIHHEIGNMQEKGADLNNIGLTYQNLGQYQKSLSNYQQALDIYRKIGGKHGEGIALLNIGLVNKELGKYQLAKDALQNSLAVGIAIGSGETWRSQGGLASVEAKLNQPDLSIQHYEQAIYNIDKIRTYFTTKQQKTLDNLEKFMPPNNFKPLSCVINYIYMMNIIALLQSQHSKRPNQHYDRKAIEIFERKQGRIFLEEMGKSGARRFVGLPTDIIQQEQTLANQWQRENITPKQWEKLEKEQAKFETMLAKKHPKYHALKYPKPANLKTLQNQVLHQDEMMLVYNVMEENTILWVIGKHYFQMFTIPLLEQQLDKAINDEKYGLRQLITNRLPEFDTASHELYNQLIPKAVRKIITGAKTLYIIPTGSLYVLPFEALVTNDDDEPHYLIQDHAIAYLSPASLLKTIRDTKSEPAPKPFLAFADPVYPPCNSTNTGETIPELRTRSYLKAMDGCFSPLPQTADEVRQIAKLFQADPTTSLYLGAEATRSKVFALNEQQLLDDYRYIMFSVHGVIPEPKNMIEQPALVLSNPTQEGEGYLTMADAFGLKLNAKLVNLSACNTGRGEHVRGEGIRGLTRAFMYAGTPATSVTLWSVAVNSAKEFSIELFTNLKTNLEKGKNQQLAQALKKVKLNMIEGDLSQKYSDPFHWAGFVVYGDGQ